MINLNQIRNELKTPERFFQKNDWPHQRKGLVELWQRIATGETRICLTSPTGGGKTRMAIRIISMCEKLGLKWVYYLNRKFLFEQTDDQFRKAGFRYGYRASGYPLTRGMDGQLAMIDTEKYSVLKFERRTLHPADVVIVDECHNMVTGLGLDLQMLHEQSGAIRIGLTATPIGIGALYDTLIVAGKNSELRACKAHAPALHFAPDEPDLEAIGWDKEDGKIGNLRDAFGNVKIVSSVIHNWRTNNPEEKPTLLFASGVKESIWMTDEFLKAGITAAHIDGNGIYYGERDAEGEPVLIKDKEERNTLMKLSESGDISVICNRFVAREGIDWPWIGCVIFATTFTGLTGYLQAGGRGIRYHPNTLYIIVNDHGGNWWKFGSLNEDRDFKIGCTDRSIARERRKKFQDGEKEQDQRCPKCSALRSFQFKGEPCWKCGWKYKQNSRMVIQSNGELKKVAGNPVKRKRQSSDIQKAWDRLYWPACKSQKAHSMTFKQVKAIFERNNPNFKLWNKDGNTHVKNTQTGELTFLGNCPHTDSQDWDRRVKAVDFKSLQRPVRK